MDFPKELVEIDITKFDIPETEFPEMDFPKLKLPEIQFPEIQLPEMDFLYKDDSVYYIIFLIVLACLFYYIYNQYITEIKMKEFIQKLKDIYPNCKHDDNVDCSNYSNHYGQKVTYGEMEYDGIEKLYSIIEKKYNPNMDCFMDIGSGRGKLCMYMSAQPNIDKVFGIEIVEERHNDANRLKNKLNSEFTNKIELLNMDIFEMNLREHSGKNNFIWFSNLCFDQNIIDNIFEKIKNELPEGSIICCSKKPDNEIGLNYLESIEIPMSWSKESIVYIYKL